MKALAIMSAVLFVVGMVVVFATKRDRAKKLFLALLIALTPLAVGGALQLISTLKDGWKSRE